MTKLALALMAFVLAGITGCVEHHHARQSCLDALASWPAEKPCPPEWFAIAVANLKAGIPCHMHEVGGA